MDNETQKLGKFKKAVFGEADKKAQQIIEQAQSQADEQLEAAKQQAQELVEQLNLQADKAVQEKAVREISAQKLESKKNVLRRREQLKKEVFDKVRERVEKLRASGEYVTLLENMAKECLEKNGRKKGRLYVGCKDAALLERLSLGGAFECAVKDSISMGGMLVAYDEDNLVYDYTFDSAFELEQENFTGRCELMLSQM